MKSQFQGYYPPTDAEYKTLWQSGLIVLDTNVLLDLYRLPSAARNEMLGVLKSLQHRLWVPHQVALEFQRRRLTVIASERKSTESTLESASKLMSSLSSLVNNLELDKRGLDIDPKPILDELEKANAKLIDAIKKAYDSQLDISSIDPIRDEIDSLLKDRVGVGPASQGDLDQLTLNADDRYKEKIPPGFGDIDKDKNPNEATFIHDQIKYTRKYGDLILWHQLIDYVKSANVKSVLLVTGDKKDDWWWKEQGKKIGPHPELVREIMKLGKLDFYWMNSPEQFLEAATKYYNANVSPQSVIEMKQLSDFNREQLQQKQHFHENESLDVLYFDSKYSAVPAVVSFLDDIHDDVIVGHEKFPDILAISNEQRWGYEIKLLRSFDRFIFGPAIVNTLLRGYLEMRENRLSHFTLIIVVNVSDYQDILKEDRTYELCDRLDKLLAKYPISGIIVGTVINHVFNILVNRQHKLESNY